jgi:hypothetical protein
MVPVVPFAVFFAAIVAAQRPECHALSHAVWVCAEEPPKPAELSIKHFYPPDMELNADIVGVGRKEVRKPRMPPYTVRAYPIIPQACAPDKDGIRPERLPSGRCDDNWDGVRRCPQGRGVEQISGSGQWAAAASLHPFLRRPTGRSRRLPLFRTP